MRCVQRVSVATQDYEDHNYAHSRVHQVCHVMVSNVSPFSKMILHVNFASGFAPLLGSFHHCSRSSCSSRCPRTLVALPTGSLAVVPSVFLSHHWLFDCGFVCGGRLRLRGSFLASSQHHPSIHGKVTTTCSAVCEVWSERFSVPAARRCSPIPLRDTLSCVHLHNEGFHRGAIRIVC